MSEKKLSFSFSSSLSNKRKRPAAEEPKEKEEKIEYITEIRDNELYSPDPVFKKKGPLVIPLVQPKRYPTATQTTNSQSSSNTAPAPTSLGTDSIPASALQTPSSHTQSSESSKEEDNGDRPYWYQRSKELSKYRDEIDRFKFDLEAKAEDVAVEVYNEVPVDQFAEALMRGMGWEPGKPIGLTNARVVAPLEKSTRGNRLGLGATPKPTPPPAVKKSKK